MSVSEGLAIFGAVAILVGGLWAVMKVVVGRFESLIKLVVEQFEKRLNERFELMEKARDEGRKLWDQRFLRLEQQQHALERDVLELKADLPVNYVRREDAIRSETVINAKLDAVAAKIDLVASRQRQGG